MDTANDRMSGARAAGIAYLVTIAAGLFAEAYARGAIFVVGDPGATAARLGQLEYLYRWSIVADCAMLGAYSIVTALLFRLFRPISISASLVAALFSLLGLGLLASATALLTFPLLDAGASYQALRLHAAAYGMTGMFFGPYCLLIGWLAIRSRFVPVIVGLLMALAGIVLASEATLALVAPAVSRQIPDVVTLLSLVGEASLALWLTVFGIRDSKD